MAWSKFNHSRSSERSRNSIQTSPTRMRGVWLLYGHDQSLAHRASLNGLYQRSGFTLVEMLVAVTLVLLMMVMFGEIFQLASGAVTKQRIMADNDQNARTFITVIRADLDKRSFRTVVPFYANEPVDQSTPFGPRKGYFSISNNDPSNGTDDVLQFTADTDQTGQNADSTDFFGRAQLLPQSLRNPLISDTVRRQSFLQSNQPDRDDKQITPNEAGASPAAEISYWMRGGKLYRRAMLIRQADTKDDDPQPQDANNNQLFLPASYLNEDANGNGVLDSGEDANGNGVLDGNLWGEFDYSVHRNPFSSPGFAIFNGISGPTSYMLNSTPPLTGAPGLWTPSLGQTWNRFGNNHEVLINNALNGLPREFTSATASPRFIGRFTHQETSDARFQYPQRLSYSSAAPVALGFNPMNAASLPALTLNSDELITQFSLGNRVGVDLLLSHVQEFRVEVWDERLNDFAPIGHNLPLGGGIDGDYHRNRQLNGTFGALGAVTYPQKPATYPALETLLASGQRFANSFDTWHPRFNRDNRPSEDTNGNGQLDVGEDTNGNGRLDLDLGNEPDRPPYRPMTIDPTGVSGPTYTNPSTASLWWTPDINYQVGDIVFPRREDLNGNGALDPGEDGTNGFPADGTLQENVALPLIASPPVPGLITEDINNNGMLDMGEDGYCNLPANGILDTATFNLRQPLYPTGLTFSYRCIRAGRSASVPVATGFPSILDEPFTGALARHPGSTIIGLHDQDRNGDGDTTDPGEVDYNGNGVPDVNEPDWLVEYNVRPLRAIRITVRFEHPTSKQMKQVTIVHSLRDTTKSVPFSPLAQ